MKNKDKTPENKVRLKEVIDIVKQTAEAKGWETDILNIDEKTWKYASIHVRRYTGRHVEGNFDITIDGGVKIERQLISTFNPHGFADLHDAVMSELKKLQWLPSSKKKKKQELSPISKVNSLLKRFHRVARQLQQRYDDRESLVIKDEYDVQDLLHAILCLFFDDIRPEEHTPSYAGASSRLDFLLKNEKIVIETKMTNRNLKDKKIGEQLIIDIKRYQSHPECNTLVCFVYDQGGFLKNPTGLINDISSKHDNLDIILIIEPNN